MAQNYVLLERIELNASAATVTFVNIPQSGYTDLKIVMSARSDNTDDYFGLTFNGSSSSFTSRSIQGNGSSASSATRSDNFFVGTVVQSSLTANTFSNNEIYIPNYRSSNNKSFSFDAVQENNATSALSELFAGLWSNTAAITSIGFVKASGNFVAGSTFSLYGVAKLGTTPAIAPKADGGNVIATDGTYWYHAFLSNGTFTPQVALSADILCVAGGGAGGTSYGGGGGAGGVIYFAGQSLTSGTNSTVTVGAGGTGLVSGTQTGNNGNNSSFASLAAAIGGGGGGGGGGATNGVSGGSGGGSSRYTTGGASTQTGTGATAFYGNSGGTTTGSSACSGGGGAGAAGTGGGSGTTGGNGGNGTTAFSSWGLATNTGQNVSGTVYFAGGGAGNGTGAAGVAGYGGGALPAPAAPATVNTGGGGSDGNNAGGSGIVIVRYLVA